MHQNLKDRTFNNIKFKVICYKMPETWGEFVIGNIYSAGYWMSWYDKNNTLIEVTGDGVARISSMDNFKYLDEVRNEKIDHIIK